MTSTTEPGARPGPARAVDVAEYILAQQGEMSAMKLHRLVYYCQAWHLAWSGAPLFEEEIHAWANGPVVPALYELHEGDFTVRPGYFYAKLAALETEQQQQAPELKKRRAKRAALTVVAAMTAVVIAAFARIILNNERGPRP